MRILLIASAYNSMTQRVHAELVGRGHEVSIELALRDEVMRERSGAMTRTSSSRRC
jgi:putative two-component system hydrogenase maturation factor HypX/HoxX